MSRPSRKVKPADLVVELNGDGDCALVKAVSAAGTQWILSHPCPPVVDDLIDYDLIVETCELQTAIRIGLVIWRVYSSRGRRESH